MIAAVVVILIAVVIGLNSIQDNITFAEIVLPVLNARTLEYDDMNKDWQIVVAHTIVFDRKIRISFSEVPFKDMSYVIDIDSSQLLGLDHIHKTSTITDADIAGIAREDEILRTVRSAIQTALEGPKSAIVELGWQTVDGQDLLGFRFNPGNEGEEVFVWDDPSTEFLERISIINGDPDPNQGYTLNLMNIRFDVPVDASLVEVPPDYRMMHFREFMLRYFEENLLKYLKPWAEYLYDGVFPEITSRDEFLSQFLVGYRLGVSTPEEIKELVISGASLSLPGLFDEYDKLNLDERKKLSGTPIPTMFFYYINLFEAELEYSGGGVPLGDGNSEVFRYRSPDSDSWRVIYGDLHVENDPSK
ncbi:MAG: hypothetical protein JXA82_16365 [Sedimentisphaerales bacterium]|nr:hypothetical protein [Sedimentisphaerales bacterium]